jgi:CRISPR/Cas system CSM-associated protein Csm2 small subunit
LEDEKKQNAKRIADLEAKLAAQAEAHGFEMSKLKENFDEVRKKLKLKNQSARLSKLDVVEFRRILTNFGSRKNDAFLLQQSVVRNMFAGVGTFSSEEEFVRCDVERQ